MIVGDVNVEPTIIPCLAKGISAGLGLTWKLPGRRLESSVLSLVSVFGIPQVVVEEILLLVALLLPLPVPSCKVEPDR